MIKPNTTGIPGMNAMTDTLEFVKKLWGGMNVPGIGIPGMTMPSLSLEEINKQIADLRAVESWLHLNMNMLRGTIQALEVQSATIATLQSMGQTWGAALAPQAQAQDKPPEFISPFAPAAMPAQQKAATQSHHVGREMGGARQDTSAHSSAASGSETQPTYGAPFDAAFTAPLANSAAWWNMLQDQFTQAMHAATPPETKKPAAKTTRKSSSATARKR